MTAQVLYLSHGGGPLPLLNDPSHKELVDHLSMLSNTVKKPEAIVLVSAHWEEAKATVISSAQPALLYDYYGFPEESYSITYPASGQPSLATEIMETLKAHGVDCEQNSTRGWDHGLFVPLKIMYPDADIPCVQLSLLNSLDPQQHITLGKTLQTLMSRNILFIGSGFSFHNMRAFFQPTPDGKDERNTAFQDWLKDVFTNEKDNKTARLEKIVNWEKAPHARYCHPREEHLTPLFFCYGLTERCANNDWRISILNKEASTFYWA